MSEFRITINGKGIGKAIEIEQEDKLTHIFAGNSDIYAWDVHIDDDTLCFDIGHGFGCSDYFDFFKYELARSLPNTVINYYWYSTMSWRRGSYNIGYFDGHYITWDDDNVYAYSESRIKRKGIGAVLKCGETDTAGFTRVWVNDKEFWLHCLNVEEDCISFDDGEKGYRKHSGIEKELTKAVPDNKIIIEDMDYLTGETGEYKATYANGKYNREFLRFIDYTEQ